MQIVEALALELRLLRRIAMEHGRARHVAVRGAPQGLLQIDGGKQDGERPSSSGTPP